MSKECWQKVVEMFIDNFDVLLKVIANILYIIKYLVEVFFNSSQNTSQLNIANTSYHEISYCLVLITN